MTEAQARPFVLLTQSGCPQCERLERMLAGPLRGQFAAVIAVVHRRDVPEQFGALAARHGVQSTPALVHAPSGRVLLDTGNLGAVKAFLAAQPSGHHAG